MAAGQQKKKAIISSLHEHYRGKKKKKLDSFDYALNLRPQIYLEWDDHQNKALAKREQIGITWMDMAPFVDSVPLNHSGLADVLLVPQEIYSLNNLMEVLSFEIWATCLSESERKLLTQFLPSGTGAEQTVHSLLTGENHHFGNPLLKWSTSLCCGNLHPDDVVLKERQFRYNKKQYYSGLKNYHADMLGVLKKWKEKWSHCSDTEKLWRKASINYKEASLPIPTDKAKVSPMSRKQMPHKVNIRNGDIAKYMSYIKISKKQHEAITNLNNSGDGIHSKSLGRILGDINSFDVHPYEALEEEEKIRLKNHWLKVVIKDLLLAFGARNDEKLQKQRLRKCLEQELFEKSALIIDKADTEKLGSLPGKRIGNVESEDSPVVQDNVASTSSNSGLCQNLEHIPSDNSHPESSPMSLDQEIEGEETPTIEDTPYVVPEFVAEENLAKRVADSNASILPANNMWKPVNSHKYESSPDISPSKHQSVEDRQATFPSLDSHQELSLIALDQETAGQDEQNMLDDSPISSQFNMNGNLVEDLAVPKGLTRPAKDVWKTVDSHRYTCSDFSRREPQPVEVQRAPLPSLNSHQELNHIALNQDAVSQNFPIVLNSSPVMSQFSREVNLAEGISMSNGLTSPANEIWKAVNSSRCDSSSNLSLRKPQPIEGYQASVLPPISNDASFFPLYGTPRRNTLLPSFPRGPERLPSFTPQKPMNHIKQPSMQFLMENSMQFRHPSPEQRNPIEHGHARQMVNRSIIYSNGSHDLYPSANCGSAEQSWFPAEQRPENNNYWPRVQPSSTAAQCFGGSMNTDGSLFSVLSGCRNMSSQSGYSNMNSGQLTNAGNLGPSVNSGYGFDPRQLESTNGHQAISSSTAAMNVSWMSYQPDDNLNLQDSIGKFLDLSSNNSGHFS